MGRPHLPDFFFTADDIAAVLEPDVRQIVVAAAPERQIIHPDGRPVTICDAVLRAQRRK